MKALAWGPSDLGSSADFTFSCGILGNTLDFSEPLFPHLCVSG